MARLRFSRPPSLSNSARYSQYKSWLLENLSKDICAYCLQQNRNLEVDHFVPKEFNPGLVRAPSNLLPACRSCNGPSGKWDYHPSYAGRKKLPGDRSGFLPFNIRTDNLAALFSVDQNGRLNAIPGPSHTWAAWNISLFRLDVAELDSSRAELVEALDSASFLVDKISDSQTPTIEKQKFRGMLKTYLQTIHEHRIFYIALDINIPLNLSSRLKRLTPKPKAKAN